MSNVLDVDVDCEVVTWEPNYGGVDGIELRVVCSWAVLLEGFFNVFGGGVVNFGLYSGLEVVRSVEC